MKVFCPNCDAEYNIKSFQNFSFEQCFQCVNCRQEWYHYKFSENGENEKNKKDHLKKLAREEYRLSAFGNAKETFFDSSDDTEVKLQNSSINLNDSAKKNLNTQNEFDNSNISRNKWSLAGFATISVIFTISHIVYLFSFELQKQFPAIKNSLANYNDIIKQTSDLIRNYYNSFFF